MVARRAVATLDTERHTISSALSPAPPPLTELERRVLDAGYPYTMGLDDACDNVRRWLRAEVDRRLRETATPDPVELKCDCGEPFHVGARYAGEGERRARPRT